MKLRPSSATDSQPERYCVLVYVTAGSDFSPPGAEVPILLAHMNSHRGLSLFFNPRWNEIVECGHQDYVHSLLDDLAVRAKSDPDAVFQQVTSLGVGPIVTRNVGQWDTRDHMVDALQADFKELK